jgi:hypothetical protein
VKCDIGAVVLEAYLSSNIVLFTLIIFHLQFMLWFSLVCVGECNAYRVFDHLNGTDVQVMQLRKTCSHPYLFPGIEPEPFEEGEHLVQVALLC